MNKYSMLRELSALYNLSYFSVIIKPLWKAHIKTKDQGKKMFIKKALKKAKEHLGKPEPKRTMKIKNAIEDLSKI